MSLLYDKDLNSQVDASGTEELTAASPGWFSGTGSELGRGGENIIIHGERVVGKSDDTAATALGFNQYVTPTGKVAKIREIKPTAEKDLPKFEKPDYVNSGKAAILMGDLFEQVPTMMAATVNPALGFATAASFGADKAAEEADSLGLKGEARQSYIGLAAAWDGLGGSLPGVGGIGERAILKYGSRFAVGAGLNLGLDVSSRFSRADVLDDAGFSQQASQMRQWDTQNALATMVLGGVFNLAGGHAKDRGVTPNAPESLVASFAPDAVPLPASDASVAAPLQTSPESGVSSFTRLTRAEVKQAKSDIANANRHFDRIDAEAAAIRNAAPTGSAGANRRYFEQNRAQLDELARQREYTQGVYDNAAGRLDSHQQANAARINQDQIDASTHTVLHDNYVTESAPGLAADAASENAHVRAMDSAASAFNAGRAVDVSEHFTGDHTFIVPDGLNLDAGTAERIQLAGADVDRLGRINDVSYEMEPPEPINTPARPGVLSQDIAAPFDTVRASAESWRTEIPELADAMHMSIDAIQMEHSLSQSIAEAGNIAAACAISFGS